MACMMDRLLIVGVVAVCTSGAGAQIGFINPGTTSGSIEYRQNFAQVLPSNSWASPPQPLWQSPGSFGSGPQVDTLSVLANNSYQGALRHNLVNSGLSGPGAWSIVSPALPGTSISQLDPGGLWAKTSLRLNFDIFMTWGGSLGTSFETPFANINAAYTIAAGGSASVAVNIDYISVTNSNTLLVTQTAMATTTTPGSGTLGAGAGNFGVPIPATPGELFEIKGWIELTVDNHEGPASIEIIPAPGAGLLLALGGVVMGRRRRVG